MLDRFWIYLLLPGLPMLVLSCMFRREVARQAHLKRPLYSFRRPAGYSLQEKVELEGECIIFLIVGFALFATLPAMAYTLSSLLNFAWWSVCAAPCGYILVRLINALPSYRNHRLGLIGEQITGAELDALQTSEVLAYHDLVFTTEGRRWNIDHVLLTPRGLLVVETKARRRQRVGGQFPKKLTYDGQRILFPNGDYDTEAISQVQRNAHHLRGEISAWTGGETVRVQSVLVYPGWDIDRTGKGSVAVLSHDKLAQLLPLSGELIDAKTLAILRKNLDRESRVVLEEEGANRESEQARRKKSHLWRPLARKQSHAASVVSTGAEALAAR